MMFSVLTDVALGWIFLTFVISAWACMVTLSYRRKYPPMRLPEASFGAFLLFFGQVHSWGALISGGALFSGGVLDDVGSCGAWRYWMEGLGGLGMWLNVLSLMGSSRDTRLSKSRYAWPAERHFSVNWKRTLFFVFCAVSNAWIVSLGVLSSIATWPCPVGLAWTGSYLAWGVLSIMSVFFYWRHVEFSIEHPDLSNRSAPREVCFIVGVGTLAAGIFEGLEFGEGAPAAIAISTAHLVAAIRLVFPVVWRAKRGDVEKADGTLSALSSMGNLLRGVDELGYDSALLDKFLKWASRQPPMEDRKEKNGVIPTSTITYVPKNFATCYRSVCVWKLRRSENASNEQLQDLALTLQDEHVRVRCSDPIVMPKGARKAFFSAIGKESPKAVEIIDEVVLEFFRRVMWDNFCHEITTMLNEPDQKFDPDRDSEEEIEGPYGSLATPHLFSVVIGSRRRDLKSKKKEKRRKVAGKKKKKGMARFPLLGKNESSSNDDDEGSPSIPSEMSDRYGDEDGDEIGVEMNTMEPTGDGRGIEDEVLYVDDINNDTVT